MFSNFFYTTVVIFKENVFNVSGYTGKNCNSNIDECVSQPCQNNGTCEDGIGNYSCHCMVGFNGLNCEHNINDCTEDSCQNGGTCYDKVNNYTCSCAVGFNGTK